MTKPFLEKDLLEAVKSRIKKNDFLRKEFSRNITGIHEFFKDTSDYLNLETISRDFRSRRYKKRDFVFMEGYAAHNLYFIESGTIKTYKSIESGKEFITGIHKAGNFMGQLSSMNHDGIYLETAMVIENAEVYHIPKTDFMRLLYDNKEVSHKFMDIISNNLVEMQEQMVNMAYASVRQRVASTLLNLHEKGIIKDGPNEGVDIPREDFASIVGTATETAIRSLSDFKEEGLITMGQARRIILLDREALRAIVDFR